MCIIAAGPTTSAVVDVDDNLVPFLRLCREDDTLKIRLAGGRSYESAGQPFKVRITMPVLTALQLHGASRATLMGFQPAKTEAASLPEDSSGPTVRPL